MVGAAGIGSINLQVENRDESKFLYHTSHDSCGSSDGLAVYRGGTGYCFSCESYVRDITIDEELRGQEQKRQMHKHNEDLRRGQLHRLKDRGITVDTCEKYGVTVLAKDKKIARHLYPYYRGDEHVANKVRNTTGEGHKFLPCEGNIRGADLFGQHLFPKGSAKYITITEGELDAMAVYQMTGSRFPVVSLVHGASGAAKDIKRSLEYLDSFEQVYICFDNDEQGNKAALKAAQILAPGKAKIVHCDPKYKDACGYLQAGKIEQFTKTWWQAEQYVPSGFAPASSLKDAIRNRKHQPSVPYPWEGLNELTYGIRKKELVLVSAAQKVGKTSFCREIEYHLLQYDPGIKVGTIYLEEAVEESALGLVSVNGSKPFHLPDSVWTDAEYAEAEKILDDDRIIFYDHQGDRTLESIVSRIRYLAKGYECEYVILDNLSVMTSDHAQGDERKLLDYITDRLVALKNELDIAIIVVVHLNREGKVFGSGAPEKFCNVHIKLDRNKVSLNEDERNTTFVTVMDNRFSGRTGPACALTFDSETYRLNERGVDEFEFPVAEEVEESD